jgi:hypothetical protein
MALRLRVVAPDLLREIEQLSEGRRRELVAAVCHDVISRHGIDDPRVAAAELALSESRYGQSPEKERIVGLVEEADNRAWDFQDMAEAGRVSEEEYEQEFAKARALAAVAEAFDADSLTAASESLYEAYHAVENEAIFRNLVAEALH